MVYFALFNFFSPSLLLLAEQKTTLLAGVVLLASLAIFILLLKFFEQCWLFYKQNIYKEKIDWTLVEIRVPREVLRTPQAMEQFFKSVHALRNAPGDFLEKYKDGEVTLWWSFEAVSFGGEVHFFIRTPKNRQQMITAALYAQYPNIEVVETEEDYVNRFPAQTWEIYRKKYDMFGGELILSKADVYPITTYEFFKKDEEELALDPLSALVEVLANIRKEEEVWIQIPVKPIGAEWQKEGKKIVDELVKRKVKKEMTLMEELAVFLKNLAAAPFQPPVWPEEVKEEKSLFGSVVGHLTPGEQEVVKAIEHNIALPGFESLIRYLYFAPLEVFNSSFALRALRGAFNQYASENLNSFKSNKPTETRTRWIYYPYVFNAQRKEARKQRILRNYRNRLLPESLWWSKIMTSHPLDFNIKSKSYVLNAAELATIYHVPAEEVLTAPHLKRAESKRMGPPSGLPIFQ